MKSDVNSQMTNIQKVLLAPGGKRALMNAYFKADGPSQRHKLISWLKILAPGNWAIHLRFAGAKRHLKQHNMAFRSAQRSLLLNPQSVDGEKFMVLGFGGGSKTLGGSPVIFIVSKRWPQNPLLRPGSPPACGIG